jgi:hypothetical protein
MIRGSAAAKRPSKEPNITPNRRPKIIFRKPNDPAVSNHITLTPNTMPAGMRTAHLIVANVSLLMNKDNFLKYSKYFGAKRDSHLPQSQERRYVSRLARMDTTSGNPTLRIQNFRSALAIMATEFRANTMKRPAHAGT